MISISKIAWNQIRILKPLQITKARSIFYALLFLSMIASATVADAGPICSHVTDAKYPSLGSIPAPLSKSIQRYEEAYIAKILSVIRERSQSQQWIDKSDADSYKKKFIEGQRRLNLAKLLLMDANLDGQVTIDEARIFFTDADKRETVGPDTTSQVNDLMKKYDADNDGVISLKEMGHYDDREAEEAFRQVGLNYALPDWLSLDQNKDGKLTLEELTELGCKAFNTVDKDGDGIISFDELKTLQATGK